MSEIYGSSVGLKQACRTGAWPGQPKEWPFELADAGVLAQRLAAAVAQNTQGQSSATDDDIRYGQLGATCATWATVPARCRATRSRFSLDDHGEGPRPGMVRGPFVAGSGGASSVP